MCQGREQLDIHDATRLGHGYVLTQMQQKQQTHIHQLTEQLQSKLTCRLPETKLFCRHNAAPICQDGSLQLVLDERFYYVLLETLQQAVLKLCRCSSS